MIGTEGYAPPEQYRGDADARTDIYALGATLHHLATGNDPRFETPFTFDQRSPRGINPRLSQQLEAAILRAVAYAPNDRFASAAEFKATLLACRPGQTRALSTGRVNAAPPPPAAPDAPKQKPIRTRILPTITADDPPRGAPAAPPAAPQRAPLAPVAERFVWSTSTGDEVRGSGAVAGRLLLIGSYDARLHALDLQSGLPQWQFAAGRGVCATPAVWGDSAIVGSEDGAVYAVGLAGGDLRWR